MSYNDYDNVAMRWVARCLGKTTKPNLLNRRMPTEDDRIYSYGLHFEMARIMRNRKGEPTHWLINGDVWGNTTSKHQGVVRNAIGRTDLPSVTIPHQALQACGIVFDSIQIVEVKADWWETRVTVSAELPEKTEWEYEHTTLPGTGGYCMPGSLEEVSCWANGYWRIPDGAERVETVIKNTGRKTLVQRRRPGDRGITWEMAVNEAGEIEYRNERLRHWLGGSVIRAQVEYTVWVKCPDCNGTGKAEPWQDWRGETFDHCRECTGFRASPRDGRRPRTRRRWAYFISGFDSNETRPSYFISELAPGVKPTSYDEAIESLKTEAVRYAESLGREVQRQGDIWAIPMPTLTLADLKKMGGKREHLGNLLGTNHRATDVVRIGRQTYARGTLRHVPDGRRPDHKMVPIGKTWHLIQKNTVPLATSGRR